MNLSRVARQTLALSISLALLHPELALAAQRSAPHVSSVPSLNLAGGAALRNPHIDLGGAAVRPTNAVTDDAAVSRHPVIEVINKLQDNGVSGALNTASDIQALQIAAEHMSAGPMRNQLLQIAQAAAVSQMSGAAAPLSQTFDGAAAAAPAAGNMWLSASRWSWLPSGIAKRFKDKGEKLQPPTPAGDPKRFEVPVERLRWTPPTSLLPASTVDQDPGGKEIVGQDRGVRSIRTYLSMPGDNYNLFVYGPEGSGRESAVRLEVDKIAKGMKTPDDLVAVTNFEDPSSPLVLKLPAGKAAAMASAVEQFVMAYSSQLPMVLGSQEVQQAKQKAMAEVLDSVTNDPNLQAILGSARLVGGKFGIVMGLPQRGKVALQLAYADAASGQLMPVTDAKRLIAEGKFSQAEYEQAVGESKLAAQQLAPVLEQAHAAAEKAAAEHLAQIDLQAAAGVVQRLAPRLIAAVAATGNHDTPEHKAWEQKVAAERQSLMGEISNITVGEFRIIPGPQGFALARVVDGKLVPLAQEEFVSKLQSGEITQDAIRAALQPFQEKMQAMAKRHEKEHEALHANDPKPTEDQKRAVSYLQTLLKVAAARYQAFMPVEESSNPMETLMRGNRRVDPMEMFKVSVLVDNTGLQGAPVVWEKSPTFERLFGGVEQKMIMTPQGPVSVQGPGGPTLRSGSFLRANGGFLILDAMDVLREPGVWPMLMRSIRNGKAEIVEGGIMSSARGGNAYHVDSKVKVVLIGSPLIKMLLTQNDQDFSRAFQGSAEFDAALDITPENILGYLHFLKKIVMGNDDILEIERGGIAKILEEAARAAGSSLKLTAQFGAINSLVKEASFFARESGAKMIRAQDIDAALAAREEGSGMFKRILDGYKAGIMKLKVEGAEVGQITGMAVAGGKQGVPMRISITHAGGPGGYQLKASDMVAGTVGSSWKKSFANTEGFLIGLFGEKFTKSGVIINVSFEQNYGGIDGDSATSTMIYGILSSLSGVPIKQNMAVTGSADQAPGNVQVIGGVNEKTEGFFEVARHRVGADKLNHGVVVPADNANDLMLNPEIVQSARDGKFAVYAVPTIADGMEVLTGVSFAEIKRLAEQELERMAKARGAK